MQQDSYERYFLLLKQTVEDCGCRNASELSQRSGLGKAASQAVFNYEKQLILSRSSLWRIAIGLHFTPEQMRSIMDVAGFAPYNSYDELVFYALLQRMQDGAEKK